MSLYVYVLVINDGVANVTDVRRATSILKTEKGKKERHTEKTWQLKLLLALTKAHSVKAQLTAQVKNSSSP